MCSDFISQLLDIARSIVPRVERNSFFHPILYRLARALCYSVFRLFWRLEVRGVENIPRSGAVLVASNHRSLADPPLIGVAIPRFVHFLAKEELFSFKPFGWLITQLNAYPLKRGGSDIGAFRAAKEILGEGGVLIVFPEGRRSKTDQMGPARPGVGLLSSMANCVVVPAYIRNSSHMKSFQKITVRFGKPLQNQGYHSHQAFAEEVLKQIKSLAP